MDYHPTKLKKDASLRMGGARGQGLVKRPNLRASGCLRKRGSIKSTYERPAQKVGGSDARRMARGLLDGAGGWTGGMRVKSQYPNPILFWERRDGTTGTEGRPAEKPARIIASSALHCPDSANSLSAPPGSKMRLRSVYSGCVFVATC